LLSTFSHCRLRGRTAVGQDHRPSTPRDALPAAASYPLPSPEAPGPRWSCWGGFCAGMRSPCSLLNMKCTLSHPLPCIPSQQPSRGPPYRSGPSRSCPHPRRAPQWRAPPQIAACSVRERFRGRMCAVGTAAWGPLNRGCWRRTLCCVGWGQAPPARRRALQPDPILDPQFWRPHAILALLFSNIGGRPGPARASTHPRAWAGGLLARPPIDDVQKPSDAAGNRGRDASASGANATPMLEITVMFSADTITLGSRLLHTCPSLAGSRACCTGLRVAFDRTAARRAWFATSCMAIRCALPNAIFQV
jgi:hypothetical protein